MQSFYLLIFINTHWIFCLKYKTFLNALLAIWSYMITRSNLTRDYKMIVLTRTYPPPPENVPNLLWHLTYVEGTLCMQTKFCPWTQYFKLNCPCVSCFCNIKVFICHNITCFFITIYIPLYKLHEVLGNTFVYWTSRL